MNPLLQKYLDDFTAKNPTATQEDVRGVTAVWMKAHADASGDTAPAPADDPNTAVSWRNFGRSVLQGGTFNFGDELGLTDRAKEDAFKKAHPWIDAGGKILGGIAAPALAVAAAPEVLGGLAGATALGGVSGMLSGVGDGTTADERIKGGIFGGVTGVAGGAAGYGLAKGAGYVGSKVADRLNPGRAVARAAEDLIHPDLGGAPDHLGTDVAGHMQTVQDIIARHNPEVNGAGSSLATATVPSSGPKAVPRFQTMLGSNASAAAENHLMGQNKVLDQTAKIIGDKMDAVTGQVPVTPELRSAMNTVREALGGRTPNLPAEDVRITKAAIPPVIGTWRGPTIMPEQEVAARPSLRGAISDFWSQRPSTETVKVPATVIRPEVPIRPVLPGIPAETTPNTVDIQVLRDALSRVRAMGRTVTKQGVDANGVTAHDLGRANAALKGVIYGHDATLQPLDTDYGILKAEQRAVARLLPTVQTGRGVAAAGDVGGSTAAPHIPHVTAPLSMARTVLSHVLTDKKGTAQFVAEHITKPGGPEMLRDLLSFKPSPWAPKITGPMRAGLFTAIPPALRSGMFQDDSSP